MGEITGSKEGWEVGRELALRGFLIVRTEERGREREREREKEIERTSYRYHIGLGFSCSRYVLWKAYLYKIFADFLQ